MSRDAADLVASAATAAPAALVVSDGPIISWRTVVFAIVAMVLGVLPGVVRELAHLVMVALRARRRRLEVANGTIFFDAAAAASPPPPPLPPGRDEGDIREAR